METSINIQEPSPEFHEKGTTEGMVTNKASQVGRKTTEIHEEGSSQGMATDEASQGGGKKPSEIHEEGSSQGIATDEASQGGGKKPSEIHEEGSSQGMATDEASQGGGKKPSVKPKVEVNEEYRSLFEAAVKGDWKRAKEIINGDPEAISARLLTTESGPVTLRDIAGTAGLIEPLVQDFRREYADSIIRHALYCADRRGGVRKIKELVRRVGEPIVHLALPIATESAPRNKEVIWYLATEARTFPQFDIVINLIKAGHWDILLYFVRNNPGSLSPDECQSILQVSAYMKYFYRSGAQFNFWEECIYQCIPPSFDNAKDTRMARDYDSFLLLLVVEPTICRFRILLWNLAKKAGKITYLMLRVAPFINRIGELKSRHECLLELANLIFKEMKHRMRSPEILQLTMDIVTEAAFSGIFEIVKLCLEQCPELMWDEGFTKQLIERVVRARHVELFRLLNAHKTIRKLMYDLKMSCDLMATVVEWSPGCVPADVSGSAFLMQRELQWFQVLDDGSSPLLQSLRIKMKKNKSDPSSKSSESESTETRQKTYWDDFVEKHKDLLQEAGRWMKDTSSSCSLVATLIITVAFAAAFTVPGGNDHTGIPIFFKKTSFTVFMVADALALFSAVTATLMFLSILTSRYAPKDFLHSLPRKMILGLTFLFLSLVFMLVAFGSALMVVLSERWKWIYIPIALLAAVPIILFAILQLPLYVEMVGSTYWPRLYWPMKIWK